MNLYFLFGQCCWAFSQVFKKISLCLSETWHDMFTTIKYWCIYLGKYDGIDSDSQIIFFNALLCLIMSLKYIFRLWRQSQILGVTCFGRDLKKYLISLQLFFKFLTGFMLKYKFTSPKCFFFLCCRILYCSLSEILHIRIIL